VAGPPTPDELIIRAAVKSGELPAYPIGKGREYQLTAEDIDNWMRSRSWEPKTFLWSLMRGTDNTI
jgi:hypothetical protein